MKIKRKSHIRGGYADNKLGREAQQEDKLWKAKTRNARKTKDRKRTSVVLGGPRALTPEEREKVKEGMAFRERLREGLRNFGKRAAQTTEASGDGLTLAVPPS